jgi:radical SAM protein with 4Fe4S-binding SPASM domain
MSLSEFEQIIEQVKDYILSILLWNYGEPFMNNEVLDMVEYASGKDIYVTTSTNGEFFHSEGFCRRIVNSGLDYLIICLDGADQETIEMFRKDSDFKSIIEGTRLICETKKKLKSKTPIIELQFILMKHNEHQSKKMRNIAGELGIDRYSEKTIGIDFHDKDFQKLATDFLPADTSIRRYKKAYDGTFLPKGDIVNDCRIIYELAVINSNGDVVPCCYDLYSDHIMGNVFEEDFKKIWHGKKYEIFRDQIRKDRKSIDICSVCSEGRANIYK